MSREKFFSQKNEVYIENNQVYKIHECSECAKKEADILNTLYLGNILVPKVFSLTNNIINMEYIKGDLLLEKFLKLCKSENQEELNLLADNLYKWFEKFYSVMPGKIRGDVNARNFICSNNGIVGIDFEETKPGSKEEDLGKMTAFFLTYDPLCEKYRIPFIKRLINNFVNNLNLNIDIVKKEFAAELNAMKVRRKGFNIDNQKAEKIIF